MSNECIFLFKLKTLCKEPLTNHQALSQLKQIVSHQRCVEFTPQLLDVSNNSNNSGFISVRNLESYYLSSMEPLNVCK